MINADGHQQKAEDIENSLQELLPDPEGKHVVAIVELTYGLLQHLIAFGIKQKHGRHLDSHIVLPREPRKAGAVDNA